METDPWRKAELIYQWVYDEIAKEPLLSIPSAVDVLESRKGDCNEHTVLFAALARSQGIPTRISLGLVWSDELSGFYYHAWPEVFAGRWIPIDPTLGQPIADATHIKLIEGSVGQWTRLVPFLGQISIDVLDVRADGEWNGGHIEGAIHMHGGLVEDRIDELPKNGRPLAVICGSGYRSTVVASVLQRAGFEDVRNVPGGMRAWRNAGLPVVS